MLERPRELLPFSGEFKTASDINHVLGKLFRLLAQGRIPRRDAIALAYIGQLMLQSLPGVNREIKEGLGYAAWSSRLQSILNTQDARRALSLEVAVSDGSPEAAISPSVSPAPDSEEPMPDLACDFNSEESVRGLQDRMLRILDS